MMNTILGPLRGESVLLLTHRRSLARKYKHGLDDHQLQQALEELCEPVSSGMGDAEADALRHRLQPCLLPVFITNASGS